MTAPLSNTLLDTLASEVEKDMKVTVDKTDMKRHLNEGAFHLIKDVVGRTLIDDLDPDTNLNVRKYLKNYARYAYYGITDEFEKNYQNLAGSIEIDAGI